MSNVINLPYKFNLREYQVEPWNAMLREDFSRGQLVVPRRNGKDILCWNGLIAKATQRVGLYYYMAPYYNQVRQIIWEGFDHSGRRFFDYIPPELVKNATKLDMRIDLVNGSQIKLQGSDQIDRIVGTNPRGIVFTEYSLHKPEAWEYLRPILAENGGWAMFNGTPRGLNHFYDQREQALLNPSWYTQFLTRDDTGIPTLEAIEEDRKAGMPAELIQQEYYCSFLSGSVGSYYASLLEILRKEGRFTKVPYDPRLPLWTAWDLGVGDSTAIWFVQVFGREIRIVDYYENSGEGLTHYIKVLKDRPYIYEGHFAPHDIEIREFTTGISRRETAIEHGIDFDVVPKLSFDDGVDAVREILPMCWFDQKNCEKGLRALMNYKKRKNPDGISFSSSPIHDWSSHGADSFRYLAIMIDAMLDYKRYGATRVNRAMDRGFKGQNHRGVEHSTLDSYEGRYGQPNVQKAYRAA